VDPLLLAEGGEKGGSLDYTFSRIEKGENEGDLRNGRILILVYSTCKNFKKKEKSGGCCDENENKEGYIRISPKKKNSNRSPFRCKKGKRRIL